MDYNRLEGRKAIQRIAAQMIRRKKAGKTTALLLGAGASITAGIPSANGFVDIIKKEYNDLVDDNDKTYQQCMGKLSREQIKELMNRYKDNKVNPAHFYLSLLVEEDKDKKVFVDSLLTVNFDKLILKSLALYNIYPTVFDSAASKSFSPGGVSYPCIFHLHGQMGNIALLNDADEMKEHSIRLKPVFNEVFSKNCLWIVVGYSGECDPVLDVLSETENFDNELYWIANKDKEPKYYMNKILEPKSRGVYYVNGFDADTFFKELTNELKLQSKILTNPFSHFYDTLNKIEITKIDDKETEPFKIIKERVKSAIEVFEEGKMDSVQEKFNKPKYDKEELIKRTSDMWLFGMEKAFDELYEVVKNSNIEEAKLNLSYAYFDRALAFHDNKNYDLAMEDLNKSIELNPKYDMAYNNRGFIYRQRKEYDNAIIELTHAVNINPSNDFAYTNRGLCLYSKGLYDDAIMDLNKALDINKENSNAYIGRGLVLLIKNENELAFQDVNKAIEIDPKNDSAYSSRGIVYYKMEEYDKALDDFNQALKLNAQNEYSYIGKGSCYSSKGDYIKAIIEYEKLIELNPNVMSYYPNLIEAYIITGSYMKAKMALDKASSLDSDLITPLVLAFLNCIILKLIELETFEAENKFEKLFEENIKITWLTKDMEKWLLKTKISKEKKDYINTLIEKMKSKIKD